MKENTDNGYLVRFNPESVECALVSEAIPIDYDSVEERFYTEFDKEVSEIDADLSTFTADYKDRADLRHPYFTLTAFRIASSDPVMLLGQSYFGNTERKDRRRIEYQFREGRHPHFLSSGPAMELGVDIGDLDSLLLYGTPPNANSYLQRVGRAGRKSGSSMIHSVSRRNPIDYYYFERPGELISSDAQPVPLNETNEEVLTRSLTWAIFDFIAATKWMPWRREASALQDAFVYDTDDGPTERSETRPNEIVTFSSLLAKSCIQLQPELTSLHSKEFGMSSVNTKLKHGCGFRISFASVIASNVGANTMPDTKGHARTIRALGRQSPHSRNIVTLSRQHSPISSHNLSTPMSGSKTTSMTNWTGSKTGSVICVGLHEAAEIEGVALRRGPMIVKNSSAFGSDGHN
ncbi:MULTISPECIES: helicase-related protein [Natrialbaceae]|uniref:helicase-related protein n=1 Tax=Natrialbaceae TaxID=1644061 RepID=UPI00207CAF9A|nr:helicase-related protein [Natronococcus sp. CG52]